MGEKDARHEMSFQNTLRMEYFFFSLAFGSPYFKCSYFFVII